MTAPINLISGTPGAGKSLFAMYEVEKLSKSTNRPVYYYNIPGVTLSHWTELSDPEHWFELPQGAIIIMDEAQQVFRQRTKDKVPEHVQKFETIRHLGMSAYLITQHPKSIDVELRRRIGRHIHLHRFRGTEYSTLYEWGEVQEEPRDGRARHVANTSQFVFPKEVYTWYKSADLHTIKKNLPWKKALMFAVPVLSMPFLFWYGFNAFGPNENDSTVQDLEQHFSHDRLAGLTIEEREALQWGMQFQERIKGQPHSARFYDSALKPATIPKIKGCGEVRTPTSYRCWCNSQQGTVITTLTLQECQHYLKFGWFDPTADEKDEKEPGKGGGGHKPPKAENNLIDPYMNQVEQGGSVEGAPAPDVPHAVY